jgi:hypothetical protein
MAAVGALTIPGSEVHMGKHLLLSILRVVRRVLLAFAATAALTLGYSLITLWLLTGAAPTSALWFVIVPLTIVPALLSAALVLLWYAAPLVAIFRALGYLSARRDQRTIAPRPQLQEGYALSGADLPRVVSADPEGPEIPAA